MFSAKIYVNTNRNNMVTVRFTNNRKKAEMSLNIQMTEKELADAMLSYSKSRFRPMVTYWQALIENIKNRLKRERRTAEDASVIKKMFSEALERMEELGTMPDDAYVEEDTYEIPEEKEHGSFAEFFMKHANSYSKRSTHESNLYTLSCMKRFMPDGALEMLDFEDINYAWLSDFEKFMEKNGLSKNTRRIHLANIRAAINDAYRRELTEADPFRRFRLKKEDTAKRSLSVEDLRKLFDYHVEPHVEYYREIFKLIFMLIGINVIDLYGLKEITKDGRIEYRRSKTGRLYSIKAEPEMLEIISRYKGQTALVNLADKSKDHRNFIKYANLALRRIGEVERFGRGGKKIYNPLWPELTTYWARHTWATIAADLDIPDAVISLALGHAGANSTTEIYIRRNLKKVDRANRIVLDWVLYNKRTPWQD